MGALCSYGRSDKLASISRARSVSQFPDSVMKNNFYLTIRQQSRMISGVQLEALHSQSQRWLNAGIDKVELSEIISSADQPVPDDVTFRNSPGFFPRLLEDLIHPRPDISRLGLLPGVTWASYDTFFNELLSSTLQAQQAQHMSQRYIQQQEQVKTIYFVRHGEATHNAAEERLGGERWESVEALSEEYFDPPLTGHGLQQMTHLGAHIAHALTDQGLMVDCIIVSPLIRAIESAQIAFAQIWNKVPVICVENARETLGVHTCDRRRSQIELKQRYPNIIFDLLHHDVDRLWRADCRETDLERLHRAARLVNFVFTLPYKYIAVVSHGGIMRAATTVMMAEAQDGASFCATTLSPSPLYGYQLEKGEMLPVCAHRRIASNTPTSTGHKQGAGAGAGHRSGASRNSTAASRTVTQAPDEPELSLSNISRESQ